MSLVYLALPIDQAVQMPGWTAREAQRICRDLADAGHDVYRPSQAFWAGDCGPQVQQINRAALAASYGVVALVPAGVPTLGVPAEIEQAVGWKVPVLIVTDIGRSAQLVDWCGSGNCYAADPEDSGLVSEGLAWLQRSMVESAAGADGRGGGVARLVFEPVLDRNVRTLSAATSLLPRRGYAGDAGLDLYVSADTVIGPHEFVDVPCGVRVDIPEGMWGLITGRSSTLRGRGLLVSNGVIDEGWTGPLFAGVQNLRGETHTVRTGDRLAQLILLPASAVGLTPVWGQVPVKVRGELGFGSTGS